jgi:hypothetical protein
VVAGTRPVDNAHLGRTGKGGPQQGLEALHRRETTCATPRDVPPALSHGEAPAKRRNLTSLRRSL